MYTTIEYLDNHIEKNKGKNKFKNIFGEIKVFIIMFIVSFVGMLLFTNAELFFGGSSDVQVVNWNKNTVQTDNKIKNSAQVTKNNNDELNSLLNLYKNDHTIEKATTISTEQDLKNNVSDYDFDFNMLPPTNRIIISKINLDVPLIDSKYKNEVDFTQGNFDEELENGVVKYPTTPAPGSEGNTLIFGHTSQERREKNPYGTVFSKIPNLEEGDKISIVREGNLYEYKIVEKTIVTPSNVDKQYQKYQNKGKDYITLMGCYPLGRTDKRMMITAVKIK